MVSSMTDLKLLTLLNVSAVKRPFEKDVPGGHRGSPALGGRRSASIATSDSPAPAPASSSKTNGANGTNGSSPGAKSKAAGKRKGVVFGGEIGPSGSTLAGKRKRTTVDAEESAPSTGDTSGDVEGKAGKSVKARRVEVEEEEGSEDEGKGRAGRFPRPLRIC